MTEFKLQIALHIDLNHMTLKCLMI